MPDMPEFEGEITVASRIVDYLSSGLYKSPAACLKELINNSYDADATRVDVFVKPDADRIIIEDDGHGMDRSDFQRHFSVISESYKRSTGDKTPSGRPKIGKIGIGFIAANEICDTMQLISTKAGSTELLDVSINFDLLRQSADQRSRENKSVAKGHYVGTVSRTEKASHYTKIFLKRIRGEAKSILAGVGTSEYSSGNKSLYGLKVESVQKILHAPGLKSWAEFDEYSRNILEVGLNVPVKYHDHWIPSSIHSKVSEFEDQVVGLNFSLSFDGSDVRKPIVFIPKGRPLISLFEHSGRNVSARGYFYAQHGAIKPQELQGLLIRIRNAAVGDYDPSFLGFSSSIGPLFQTWISGEVMANDQLEEAMNIDRRTLRVAHPAYVELQRAIHNHINELIKRVKGEIYLSASRDRSAEKADIVATKIIRIASDEIAEIAPAAARKIKREWKVAAEKQTSRKKVVQRFSVDDLYSIVMETAREILTPKELDEFLNRLTDRLLQ